MNVKLNFSQFCRIYFYSGAPETTKDRGAASYLRAISGVVARGTPPKKKFWTVGKSSCHKFFVEKCKLWSWKTLILVNFRVKIGNFKHPWSPVGHLQLSVEILWAIFSVCRKIANSCPAYLFNQWRRWGLHRGPGHRSLHKSQFTSQVLNSWFF